MTIETKRWGHLDWDFMGNARELKRGEKITVTRVREEGMHSWTIEALGPDVARATYSCPITINPDGLVIRNFPGAGGRRFENMTIEIKLISFLPWIPGNIREMSQGDTLNQKSKTSEGLYVWGIMVLTQDSALTVHARPYTVNMH